MERKIKKLENKPRKKYEFKAEKRKKRVLSSTILGLILATVICALSFSGYKLYVSKSMEGLTKNFTGGNYESPCTIPYSYGKCKYVESEAIGKVKEMIYKVMPNRRSSKKTNNLYFDQALVSDIKNFQKQNHLSRTGTIDSYLLKLLARKSNTSYYQIYYNKNLGTGTLKNTSLNTQTLLNGLSDQISSTKLKRNKKEHVGYTAITLIKDKVYYYGCDSKICFQSNAEWFSVKEKRAAKRFNMYVLSPNEFITDLGQKNGQRITLTAKYCSKGMTYSKDQSACVTNNAENLDDSYIASTKDSLYDLTNEEDYKLLQAIICNNTQRYTEAKKYFEQIIKKTNPKTLVEIIKQNEFDMYNNTNKLELMKDRINMGQCHGVDEAINDVLKDYVEYKGV